jgi:hypothetical protein
MDYLTAYGLKPCKPTGAHDIRSVLAYQIKEHIQDAADQEECESFTKPYSPMQSVHDLLMSDLSPLFRQESIIRKYISQEIKFIEVEGGMPQVTIFASKNKQRPILVAISNRFYPLLHEALKIMQILILDSRYEGVLESHRSNVDSEAYDDGSLYLRFVNTVNNFYLDAHSQPESQPFEYYYNPLDFCEIVKGARMFVACHELAHIIIPYVIETTIDSRSEEYLADKMAIEMILSMYPETMQPKSASLYEFRNITKGIFLYLTLLGKVESYYHMYENRSHPYAYSREMAVFNQFMIDTRVQRLSDLQWGIIRDYTRIKQFKMMKWHNHKEPFGNIYRIHKDPVARRLYKLYNVSYYLASTKPLFNVSEFEILKSHFLIIKDVIEGLPQNKQDPTSISISLYLMADRSEMGFLSECDKKIYGAFQESLVQILWQLKKCLLLDWEYMSFFPNEAFTSVAEEAIDKVLSID